MYSVFDVHVKNKSNEWTYQSYHILHSCLTPTMSWFGLILGGIESMMLMNTWKYCHVIWTKTQIFVLNFLIIKHFFFWSAENSSQVVIIPIILSSLAVVLISSILAVLKCRFELCPDFSFLAHSASLSTDRISMPMDCRKPGEFAVSDQYPMGKVLILRLTFDCLSFQIWRTVTIIAYTTTPTMNFSKWKTVGPVSQTIWQNFISTYKPKQTFAFCWL